MRVRVLFFGVLKDIFAGESEEITLSPATRVEELLALYKGRERCPMGTLESIAVAVNQEYRRGEWVLRDGDEVALLPPVSGGRGC